MTDLPRGTPNVTLCVCRKQTFGTMTDRMELNPRKRRILAAVVERYIASREPVGSAALLGELDVGVKSATLRNEFAELEEMQLLMHPHTSAGRIPTDLGYRVYVDELLQPATLTEPAQMQLRRLRPTNSEVEDMLGHACELLARLTGYPAIVSIPAVQRDSVKHVQLGSVDARKMLVVIYTTAGHVEHRLFEVPQATPPARVNRVMRVLNEKLRGRTIASIRMLEATDLLDAGEAADALLVAALGFVKSLLASQADDKILVEGVVYILSQPEFAEVQKARAVLEAFEQAHVMQRVLEAPQRRGRVTVVIGQEHAADELQPLSFIGMPYRAGTATLGGVGVLGPTRMRYRDALPAVEQLALRISECLAEMIA